MMNKFKRIFAVLLAASLLAGGLQYIGDKEEVLGADVTETVPGKLTLSGALRPNKARPGGVNPSAIYLYSDDAITPDTNWKRIHKPTDDESGIWLGDKRAGGQLKKFADGWWYAEGFGTASVGDIVTIKGVFGCTTSGEYVDMASAGFRWNGAYWEEYVSVVDESECYFKGTNGYENQATSLRIVGSDTLSAETNWIEFAIAYDATGEGGVFYNGVNTDIPVKHIAEGTYYLAIGEAGITAVSGDTLAVGGVLTDGERSVQYKKAEFVFDGTKWDIVDSEMTYIDFGIIGGGRFGTGSANGYDYWDIYLNYNTGLPGENWDVQYDGITVLVDGEKVNAYVKKATESLLNVFFYSSEMPITPEAGTRFTVCAGKSLAYTVKEKTLLSEGIHLTSNYEVVWDGTQWVRESTWKEVTITGIQKDTHKSARFWKIYLQTDLGAISENGYYLNLTIDGEIHRYFARRESAKLMYMEIPLSVLPRNRVSEVVIQAGEYCSSGQYIGCKLTSDFTFYISSDEVAEQGTDYAAVVSMTVVSTAADSKNGKGFIVLTDIDDPVTPDGTNWSSRIFAEKGSGVYRNGIFTDTRLPMVKLAENTYYVALQDVGLIADAGEYFTVGGEFYSSELDALIYVEPLTVQWTGTEWEPVNPDLIDNGVESDVNGDALVNVKDLMRLLYLEKQTSASIYIGNQDVNNDSVFDAMDTQALKKVLTGQIYYRDGIAFGELTYDETEYMERCSYASPSIDGEDGRLSDEEIDASFQKYKAAGFTLLNSEFHAVYANASLDSTANEPVRAYLEAAQRNGLGVIILSDYINSILRTEDMETLYFNWREKIDEIVKNLSTYSSFRGFMMSDELSIKRAVNYQSVAGYLKENHPEVMLFSSQLPISAWDVSSLGVGGFTLNPEVNSTRELAYRDYIWNFAKESDVYIYDLYPLYYKETRWNGLAYKTWYSVSDDWFENLQYVAEEKKEQKYSFEVGITIQSCELHDRDTSSGLSIRHAPEKKEDIGFQTYTAMAYGMESFHYFTYELHPATDTTVMNSMSVNDAVYEAVRSVNADVDSFVSIYQSFNWRDTLDISAGETKNTDYSKRLLSAAVTGTQARALVGCMKNQDGFDGYMVANATGPRTGVSATVTLTFQNTTKVLVYQNGEASTVALTDGVYTAFLEVGEGAFVIPVADNYNT